ncbi:MAG: LytR/AlgR family response regulator transcription factor [Bacteroidota bacterium]
MKVVIIEDEPLVARDLENLLKKVEPAVNILKVLSSVEAAKKWFTNNTPPDLILSDIQLSDGISFDIYENLHLTCPIIFTTAFDDYAIRAFKLNSIDYLLKPIDAQELSAALTKYKSLSTENILAEQLKTLIGNWGQPPHKKYKERFLTLHRNTLIPVTHNDIAYFHKEELIYLQTVSNERYISEHQTMDEIESLINPETFFRVNRQFIIHIQSVGRVKTTHKGLTVQLKAPFNNEIDISREKATAFKQWLG